MGLSSTTLRSFAAWSLSNATNDPSKHARYAGLMHALPQAGSCMAFAIELTTPPFIYQVVAYFALSVLSIGLCFVGVRWFLVETLYGVEEGEGGIAPRGKGVGVLGDGVGKECGIGRKKVGRVERVMVPALEFGSFGAVITETRTPATTSTATLENPGSASGSSAPSAASSRTQFDTIRSTKSTRSTETEMSQEKVEGAEIDQTAPKDARA